MLVAMKQNKKGFANELLEQDEMKTSRLKAFSLNAKNNLRLSDIKKSDNAHTITYDDGTQYTGELKENKKHGNGHLLDTRGNKYIGEFFEDQISGIGQFEGEDGTRYKGEWKEGQQHGIGKESWPDGSFYEGEYKNGLKHGRGLYRWADGSTFEGDWVDGNIQGFVS